MGVSNDPFSNGPEAWLDPHSHTSCNHLPFYTFLQSFTHRAVSFLWLEEGLRSTFNKIGLFLMIRWGEAPEHPSEQLARPLSTKTQRSLLKVPCWRKHPRKRRRSFLHWPRVSQVFCTPQFCKSFGNILQKVVLCTPFLCTPILTGSSAVRRKITLWSTKISWDHLLAIPE